MKRCCPKWRSPVQRTDHVLDSLVDGQRRVAPRHLGELRLRSGGDRWAESGQPVRTGQEVKKREKKAYRRVSARVDHLGAVGARAHGAE
eukprot:SAG31_NODE_19721_length_593_cov_1.129555_1_plen_88_part_10